MSKLPSPSAPDTWPRWLPALSLRDHYTHLCASITSAGLCGTETMWSNVAHSGTDRRRCPACERFAR